jgi:methylated-DNA-[protein]-cysteine S-methyltransferase
MYYHIVPSPLGDIALTANNQGLTGLAFQAGEQPIQVTTLLSNPDIFKELNVIEQLEQYFAGVLTEFSVPLAAKGTAFQQSVWQALCTIKFGETKSYAWLANHINNPKAVRAVGSANGKNPIALIVPCHRVIGSNGKLTGYAGGVTLKQKLLLHEGITCKI